MARVNRGFILLESIARDVSFLFSKFFITALLSFIVDSWIGLMSRMKMF